MPVGIQNTASTSKKTKEPGLHKENSRFTDHRLWTEVYSQKGLTAIKQANKLCCSFLVLYSVAIMFVVIFLIFYCFFIGLIFILLFCLFILVGRGQGFSVCCVQCVLF